MEQGAATRPTAPAPSRKRKSGPLKAAWVRVRQPLARSRFVKAALTSIIVQFLRFVGRTNGKAPGAPDIADIYAHLTPGIMAVWHGQHLLNPVLYPGPRRLVAMVSRSADAEINAMALEKLGVDVVRGSGGRSKDKQLEKGGARALVALKKALDAGKNVAMIADIPNGKPRESGMGIILLARLSGRPILGVAVATSRRKILERTWDKTTINLPFGRYAVVPTQPIHVAPDADHEEMELKRQELTDALNAVTRRAYELVDGAA